MRQTACAVIASPRPIAPCPSPLLTFRLIRAVSTPIALASASFMLLRWGPSLGAWALITASTLTTRQPFRVTMDMTASSSLRLETSLYRGSDAGKCVPRSPSPIAQKSVAHRVCEDIGVRVAVQPLGVGNLDAPQDQPAPGRQRMDVIAYSD